MLNAALEVTPYEAKDWCYRGRIYLELEQTDEAFSAFEESYNKGYAQAGYYLGYCYELQGKSEEAINLYQEQIKHDPQDAGLYNQLSSCLVRQGEYQDALIMIQKGMQLADESQMADFLWNESICYEKMGNYDTAIEKLMSYLEQYPADKDAKKELAFVLQMMQERQVFYEKTTIYLQLTFWKRTDLKHLADIIDTFNKAGYETVVYSTQERADATRLAKELGASYDLVVCSGGDGTLSEVLDGVMTIDEKRRPKIGYIPAGSTNDYAYSLGLPSQMKRCANVIARKSSVLSM